VLEKTAEPGKMTYQKTNTMLRRYPKPGNDPMQNDTMQNDPNIPIAKFAPPLPPEKSVSHRSLMIRMAKWLGTLSLSQRVGAIMLIVGLGVTLYYLVIFDTTRSIYGEGFARSTGYDERVHNLGRMNERLVAVIAGIGVSIAGTILCARARG
jgi:hypothetical protein